MEEKGSQSSSKPLKAIKKNIEVSPASVAVTSLVEALAAGEPGEITPCLMELLEGLKRTLKRDQFEEILEELLFTIALLKKGA
jgi:hypothetical protein